MQHETNTSKIVARLEGEGWVNVGGTKHTKFRKAGQPSIMVPRHGPLPPASRNPSPKQQAGPSKDKWS